MNLRRIAITLIALQCLGLTQAEAATPTAKPKPRTTIAKQAPVFGGNTKATTKKPLVSKTQKPTTTKKPTLPKTKKPKSVKKSATAKKKVTTPKKKVVRKYTYRAPVRKAVPPSPSPGWPPHGFTSVGTAYARIPTGTELLGILSAMKDASSPVNSCSIDPKKPSAPAFSCAAVLVGSTQRCTWWKVSADISGIDPADATARVDLGQISVLEAGAAAKTIQTIVLVSPVPLQMGVRFSGLHALCGIGPSTDPVPSSTYAPAPAGTPSPSATPSPSNS